MKMRTIEQVQQIPGVKVTDIEDGLQVAPAENSGLGLQRSALTSAPTPIPSGSGAMLRQQPSGKVATQHATHPAAHHPHSQMMQEPAYRQHPGQVPPYHPSRQYAFDGRMQETRGYPQYANSHPSYAPQPPQAAQAPQANSPYQYQEEAVRQQEYYRQMLQQRMLQQQAMQQQQQAMYQQQQVPQQPMPGQYNQPNLPSYAWPSYAAYPNYAEVCYPKQYSPKAWPYIGPFYPYPQAPLGWRQVTLEWHDGWWWLDFDDGGVEGPFSPLFRQANRYTY